MGQFPCPCSGVCSFFLHFSVLNPRFSSRSSVSSVILPSWMGTLYYLWIKHQPFSPESPEGHASPFDRRMNVFIVFPELPREARLETCFSHSGLSWADSIHPLCEGSLVPSTPYSMPEIQSPSASLVLPTAPSSETWNDFLFLKFVFIPWIKQDHFRSNPAPEVRLTGELSQCLGRGRHAADGLRRRRSKYL